MADAKEVVPRSPKALVCAANKRFLAGKRMVLPDRIELSTSPLPMECSTTELRQHATDAGIGPKGPCKVRRSLPQGHWPRKRGSGLRGSSKTAQNQRKAAAACFSRSNCGRSGSHFVPGRLERLDQADHDLEFGHFACLVEFDQLRDPSLPFAQIGGK